MIDLHNDALLELPEKELLTYLQKSKNEGLTEVWLSVWSTKLKNPMEVIKEKKLILEKIRNNEEYPICKLHIEDAWFLTPDNLTEFIDIKPNSVGLTWNFKNSLAGGALSGQGITELGYDVISKLEEAGIQVDTAHLNRKSFYQFAKVTSRPIICTHTAFDAVKKHKRNLTDKQIKTIITSGGKIGLCLVPAFLCKNTKSCGIDSIVEHINYYRKKFGLSNLMLGTDFYGVENLPFGIESYLDLVNIFHAKIIGYSEMKQPITCYNIGNPIAEKRILITGGMHAREWITTIIIKKLMLQHQKIANSLYISFIPCCNPDGAKLAKQGLVTFFKSKRKYLLKINNGSYDFSLWKANANAVDLNVNFGACWGQGKNNITLPSPANYIGKKANSEKETQAILRFIQDFKPSHSVSFHSKGELVYYSREIDNVLANQLAELTTYKAELSVNSYGGLTDYLALKKSVPSFTLEVGSDELSHPITEEHLPEIMDKVKDIIYFLSGA